MRALTSEDLAHIRTGAELSQMAPYVNSEVAGLQKAVVSAVLHAVNEGTLTPEMALSKWMEYIAYLKLNQKFSQRVAVGNSIAIANQPHLDIPNERE